MKAKRFTLMIVAVMAFCAANSQSYYDDDIYYDASKAPKEKTVKPVRSSGSNTQYYTYPGVVVAEYPSADNYTVNGTRTISVDDYNRRGIFATDSLSNDTTATDFAYTRRIEQFYNPEIVSASGDKELAGIYYAEPAQVNIYVNTPSSYWGYDYFYPSYASWYSPYWSPGWRWNSPWYWNSWYDPYWSWNWGWGPSWNWGWGPSWGPSWGWGPSWNWGWDPSWGWSRPYNPRHPGAGLSRPGRPGNGHISNTRPGNNSRPQVGVGNRHQGASGNRYNGGYGPGGRPSVGTGNNSRPTQSGRPAVGTRPSNNSNNNNYNRPSNNNSYNRPSYNTNGSRTPSYRNGSSGGSRGGSFGGGGRSSGGGRGRH